MIRHRFEPSVTLSSQPRISLFHFGFWKDLMYEDQYGLVQYVTYVFSV